MKYPSCLEVVERARVWRGVGEGRRSDASLDALLTRPRQRALHVRVSLLDHQ